jgi:hypothetical protein
MCTFYSVGPVAHADTFAFSETIGGTSITGTFNGVTLAGGNDVGSITNFSFFIGSLPSTGGVYESIPLPDGTYPSTTLSFNGANNNLLMHTTVGQSISDFYSFGSNTHNVLGVNGYQLAYIWLTPVNSASITAFGNPIDWVLINTTTSPVPVPPAIILFASGLLGLGALRKKNGQAQNLQLLIKSV